MSTPGRKKRVREPEEADSLLRRRKGPPGPPDVHCVYRPDDTSLFDSAFSGQVLHVLVLAKDLYQPPLTTAKLVGGSGPTDHYHPDSDVVVAAVHAGKFQPSALPPHLYGAVIEVAVHPGQQRHHPFERCGVRSRGSLAGAEASFQPVRVRLLFDETPPHRRKSRPRRLQPVSRERVVMFDNTNRLRMGYHITHIRDRGFEEKDFTSTRFKAECLYLGSGRHIFELSMGWRDPEAGGERVPKWRWARLTRQALRNLIMSVVFPEDTPPLHVPLEAAYREVVLDDLDWAEVVWGTLDVTLRGVTYPLTTMEWKKVGDCLGDSDAYTEADFFPDGDGPHAPGREGPRTVPPSSP